MTHMPQSASESQSRYGVYAAYARYFNDRLAAVAWGHASLIGGAP